MKSALITNLMSSISSQSLKKVRRLAKKAKTYQDCVSCIAYGTRCSEIRPCTSCMKKSRPCVRVSDVATFTNDYQAHQEIEHPLPSNTLLILDHPPQPLLCRCKFGWAQEQLVSFLCVGSKVEHLARSFESLSMLDDITPVLDSLKNLSLGSTISRSSGSSDSREPFWDVNTETAFFSVKMDVNTRQRLAVRVNRRQAAFFEMHGEEFLARTANMEHPFPSPDLDTLLLVLYRAVQTACFGTAGGVIYFRMRIGRGLLARLCISAVRDGDGRVCEVRRTFREIGPDEYDTATRLQPEACPLFALGDRRSGRQLLADSPADNIAPLSALPSTASGRRFLASLPAAVRSLAACFLMTSASNCMTTAASAAAASAAASDGAAAMLARIGRGGSSPFSGGEWRPTPCPFTQSEFSRAALPISQGVLLGYGSQESPTDKGRHGQSSAPVLAAPCQPSVWALSPPGKRARQAGSGGRRSGYLAGALYAVSPVAGGPTWAGLDCDGSAGAGVGSADDGSNRQICISAEEDVCWLESGSTACEGLTSVSGCGSDGRSGEESTHWAIYGGAAAAASSVAAAASSASSAANAAAVACAVAAGASVSAATAAVAALEQAAASEAWGRRPGPATAAADGTDGLWGVDDAYTSSCGGLDGIDLRGTFLGKADESFEDLVPEAHNLFWSLSEADDPPRSPSEPDDPFRSLYPDSTDRFAGLVPAADGEQTRLAVLPGDQASGSLFYLD